MFGRKRKAEGERGPTTPDPEDPLAPPVDLGVPLTNPELVRVLQADPSDPQWNSRVANALVNSTLMMAVQYSHPDGRPPIENGTVRAGSLLAFHTVRDEADHRILVLFTDWESLRASTGPEGWDGQVIQAVEALGLAQSQYSGHAVVNPHGPLVTLPITPSQTRQILDVVRRT